MGISLAADRFSRYEICPVYEDGQNGLVERCASRDAALRMAFGSRGRAFWRLFGWAPGSPAVAVGDFFSFEDASKVYQLITGVPAPEEDAAAAPPPRVRPPPRPARPRRPLPAAPGSSPPPP